MNLDHTTRRNFIRLGAAVAGSTLLVPHWVAAQTALIPTEPQIEGPFFPLEVPRVPSDFGFDRDNDLSWVNGKSLFALGTFLEISGRVLSADGRPIGNTEIQLWQCDNYGRYKHPGDTHTQLIDENFQGFGQAVTNGDGVYRFRTIKPVVYPGRTPHLHFKLKNTTSADLLTTQMYVAGEPGNATDSFYQEIPANLRRTVTATLSVPRPVTIGGLPRLLTTGQFDIVLGVTPRIS
jgi:protocatechuate 3,4-dioxygenase, beta subunit